MNPTLKKSLISLGVFVAVNAVGYVTKNLSSFDIPSGYLPLVAAGLAVLTHWLDELLGTQPTTPTVSTSSQKTV